MSSPGAAPRKPTNVTVVVRHPGSDHGVDNDYTTSVPVTFTVGELKVRIASEHLGNPPAGTQRLIFGGALLRDDTTSLRVVLGEKADLHQPQVFHLVTSNPSNPSTPSSSEAMRRNAVAVVPRNTSEPTPPNAVTNLSQQGAPATPSTPISTPMTRGQPGSSFAMGDGGSQTVPTTATTTTTQAFAIPYVGIGQYSPHVQNVYASAYAAAYNQLTSSGTPTPLGLAQHVGVFGFPGSPYFTPFLNQGTCCISHPMTVCTILTISFICLSARVRGAGGSRQRRRNGQRGYKFGTRPPTASNRPKSKQPVRPLARKRPSRRSHPGSGAARCSGCEGDRGGQPRGGGGGGGCGGGGRPPRARGTVPRGLEGTCIISQIPRLDCLRILVPEGTAIPLPMQD